MSWQWRMMQNLKRNWLVSSRLTWGIWWILTRALKNLKILHCNRLLLTKVCNFWAKKVQRSSYVWWHWRLMQDLKENWFALSKMTLRIWQIFVHRLKNSHFILSKMAELNQNKNPNSKQPNWPDAVWKL